MLRFCVALLLFLSLTPATAAVGAEASAQNRITAVQTERSADAALLAQPELLQTALARGGEGLPKTAHDRSTGNPSHGIRTLPSPGGIVRPATPHRVDPVAPSCERLPYDATAPPAR